MNIADEIQRLHELQKSGALSQSEFERAKAMAMSNYQDKPLERSNSQNNLNVNQRVDDAERLKVKFQIIMAVVVMIVFLIFMASR